MNLYAGRTYIQYTIVDQQQELNSFITTTTIV